MRNWKATTLKCWVEKAEPGKKRQITTKRGRRRKRELCHRRPMRRGFVIV